MPRVDRGRAGLPRADDHRAAARHARRAGASGPDQWCAAGYYRADRRFSAATNAGRVQSAQRGAAALAGAAARAGDFEVARRQAELALRDTPPGRVVRTRHGDRMLLTEFLRTRVLELAVHGLDLAAALGREPWVTAGAAEVSEDLLLPPAAAARLRAETGWDRVGLIARLTSRNPVTPSERPYRSRRRRAARPRLGGPAPRQSPA